MPSDTPVKATYADWANNTHSSWWKDPGLRRCTLYCVLLFFGIFSGGYGELFMLPLRTRLDVTVGETVVAVAVSTVWAETELVLIFHRRDKMPR